jgi:G3E family GTPase
MPMNTASNPTATPHADVILIAGFLGAGKTTLLKRILTWETDLSDTVVVVNEFGEVGIDGDLLKTAGSDVVELTSGCICCTLSADLVQSLTTVQQRFHPRRVFIEASGVADPSAVIQALSAPQLTKLMRLHKVVTVLDADFWEGRESFGPLFYNQLEMAHLILLNKVDLHASDKIPAMLAEIHKVLPSCQVVPTIRCGIDPEALWAEPRPKSFGLKPISFYRSGGTTGTDGQGQSVSADQFVTFAFQDDRVVDEACFENFVKKLPWEVFRMKGPVYTGNRTRVINFVGGKFEWSPWEGQTTTKLAFIGWDIDSETVLAKLRACVGE